MNCLGKRHFPRDDENIQQPEQNEENPAMLHTVCPYV